MENIYVWGMGFEFKLCEDRLERDYNILGYIDNSNSDQNRTYKGRRIVNINQFDQDACVIIAVKKYVNLIYELIERNILCFKVTAMLYPDNYQDSLMFQNGKLLVKDKRLQYESINGEVRYIDTQDDVSSIHVELLKRHEIVELVSKLPLVPTCRDFGFSRGTAVDRIYVEKFLEMHKQNIYGKVLEIADSTYTNKFGNHEKGFIPCALHIKGWGENVIQGNLETGEGIEEQAFDAAIITQTLMLTYNLDNVASNIYKLLKPKGCALITVSGISQISRYDEINWGSYWGFHRSTLINLFAKYFKKENIEIAVYGNVKTATALLYGITAEELGEDAYAYDDPQYPVIIGVKLIKE